MTCGAFRCVPQPKNKRESERSVMEGRRRAYFDMAVTSFLCAVGGRARTQIGSPNTEDSLMSEGFIYGNVLFKKVRSLLTLVVLR